MTGGFLLMIEICLWGGKGFEGKSTLGVNKSVRAVILLLNNECRLQIGLVPIDASFLSMTEAGKG